MLGEGVGVQDVAVSVKSVFIVAWAFCKTLKVGEGVEAGVAVMGDAFVKKNTTPPIITNARLPTSSSQVAAFIHHPCCFDISRFLFTASITLVDCSWYRKSISSTLRPPF